jgi:aspartyl-tRNA(Asn)/glutamyl-tRNA(Gln) amidotransferase subunit C
MALTPDDVDHVTTLARLGLDAAERRKLGAELEAILEHISRLQRVDTSDVAETAQVGDLVNVMRNDGVGPCLGSRLALRNAPATDGEYFVVGAIQENELDG